MSMSYYSGRIDVQAKNKELISFEYEFDNEICPTIYIPQNWKALCSDKDQLRNFVDCLLMADGLQAFIEEFDESYPFDDEDMKDEPEYNVFLNRVENECGQIERITVSVIAENDNSVVSQKVLEL